MLIIIQQWERVKYGQIEVREDGHFAIVHTFTTSNFPLQTVHRGEKLPLVEVDSCRQPLAVLRSVLRGKVIFIEIDSIAYLKLHPLNWKSRTFSTMWLKSPRTFHSLAYKLYWPSVYFSRPGQSTHHYYRTHIISNHPVRSTTHTPSSTSLVTSTSDRQHATPSVDQFWSLLASKLIVLYQWRSTSWRVLTFTGLHCWNPNSETKQLNTASYSSTSKCSSNPPKS